jgi:hypothetical protein
MRVVTSGPTSVTHGWGRDGGNPGQASRHRCPGETSDPDAGDVTSRNLWRATRRSSGGTSSQASDGTGSTASGHLDKPCTALPDAAGSPPACCALPPRPVPGSPRRHAARPGRQTSPPWSTRRLSGRATAPPPSTSTSTRPEPSWGGSARPELSPVARHPHPWLTAAEGLTLQWRAIDLPAIPSRCGAASTAFAVVACTKSPGPAARPPDSQPFRPRR